MDNNYKPNSHRAKAEQAEERKVEKIVKAPVKTKKKNELRKLTDIFIAEDASNVKSYVFMDVIVPAIKNALYDVVVDGIGMILGKGAKGGRTSGGLTERTSYGSYYGGNRDRHYDTPRARTAFEFDDIIFGNRGDADMVLDQLYADLRKYGLVRVADLYELAGLTAPYTAHDFGWSRLNSADVVRVRDGYIIKLPKPMPIDR